MAVDLRALVRMNDVEAVREILRNDRSMISDFESLLPYAIYTNGSRSKSMVDTLLLFGADPNSTRTRAYSPLTTAMSIRRDNMIEVIQSLIIAGADVNSIEKGMSTPLINAITFITNHTSDVVQALLLAGADVNVQGKSGDTVMMELLNEYEVFHTETEQGLRQFLDLFDMLVTAGSDIDTIENDKELNAMDYIQRLPSRLRRMVLSRL